MVATSEDIQAYLGLFLIGAISWSCQTSGYVRR